MEEKIREELANHLKLIESLISRIDALENTVVELRKKIEEK
ncbi:MAG: hypothetical protein ACE5K4_03065 [Candidatus Hydrothermarchaeota archaeon]